MAEPAAVDTSSVSTDLTGLDDDEDALDLVAVTAEARAAAICCRSLSAAAAPKTSSVLTDFRFAAADRRSLQRRESSTPLERVCSARRSAAVVVLFPTASVVAVTGPW